MTRKRFSILYAVMVLLLYGNASVVQATSSGATVSPSASIALPPCSLVSESTSGAGPTGAPPVSVTASAPLIIAPSSSTPYVDMVTAASPAERTPSISELRDTLTPGKALPTADTEATGATSATMPTQTSAGLGPTGNGGSTGAPEQGPSNTLENNYGAIFGISVGALVVTIVMCMSIIFILDRIFRVISKEDHKDGLASIESDSDQDKRASWRFKSQQTQGNPIVTVQEEEGNAGTSTSNDDSTAVAGGSHCQHSTVIKNLSSSRYHSTSALSDTSHNSTNVVMNYKRHSSASAIVGNHHYLAGVKSDSHCCTTIAEVHQNPEFEDAVFDTAAASTGQEELV